MNTNQTVTKTSLPLIGRVLISTAEKFTTGILDEIQMDVACVMFLMVKSFRVNNNCKGCGIW